MSDDREWIEARITATKELIEKYEAALLAVSTGAQSYTLDTGQTRQVVSKADLASLRIALNELENRLSHYRAKLCGSMVNVIPGF